jgi:hypothetical protein
MVFFPGLAISLAVFALNLLGDSIRDLTDPRWRGGLGSPAGDLSNSTEGA